MTFKVLLVNQWSPSPEVGGYTNTINETRGMDMKYIAYYEFKQGDTDKVIELFHSMQKIREKEPDKFPKSLSSTYWFHSQMKGFTIYEVENEEQVINHYIHYHPWVTFKFKSISETIDFIKLYKK